MFPGLFGFFFFFFWGGGGGGGWFFFCLLIFVGQNLDMFEGSYINTILTTARKEDPVQDTCVNCPDGWECTYLRLLGSSYTQQKVQRKTCVKRKV